MKPVRAPKSGRMPALLALFASVFLLASLTSAGSGDPWKSKPYQQWDDKDIDKVVRFSPWSRVVVIETTWEPLNASELAAVNGAVPGAEVGTQGSGGGKGGTATVLPAEHGSGRTRGEDASFSVYWMSSRTMRAAMARKSVLHAGKDPAEADKFVNQQLDTYAVLLQCEDMAPFMRNDEKFFEPRATLIIKSTKQKIAPSQVIYQRDPESKKVGGVVFMFPKKGPNGEEIISPQEKGVEFDCKIGNSLLKAPFEIQKMADAKGSDL
jgi:hypothetical protein